VYLLFVMGIAFVILGVAVLLLLPNRPGGQITAPGGWQVSSGGAGLPLIVLGIVCILLSQVNLSIPALALPALPTIPAPGAAPASSTGPTFTATPTPTVTPTPTPTTTATPTPSPLPIPVGQKIRTPHLLPSPP
jgi:hypothetical protein